MSRALKAAEIWYTPLENVVYGLVITTRKLITYFQAHPFQVLTNQPLSSVLHNLTSSERLVKWVVELTQFEIEYHPRPLIKGYVLANFIVEYTAQ